MFAFLCTEPFKQKSLFHFQANHDFISQICFLMKSQFKSNLYNLKKKEIKNLTINDNVIIKSFPCLVIHYVFRATIEQTPVQVRDWIFSFFQEESVPKFRPRGKRRQMSNFFFLMSNFFFLMSNFFSNVLQNV